MALSDENNGGTQTVMPVQPLYGGGYPMMNGGGMGGFGNGFFGGDSAWLLLLILLCGGGWGGLGGFGMGGMMWPMMMGGMGAGYGLDYLYPWLNNSQNINDGFRDQQLNTTVQGIQNAVTSGFGDVQLGIAGVNQNISTTGAGIQNALCNGFAGVNQNVSNIGAGINLGMANGFAGVNQSIAGVNSTIANTAAQGEVSANARHSALTGQLYNNEIANLNRSFAEQTANTQGFSGLQGQIAQSSADIRLANCQTNNTIQAEGAASRYASAGETRDIIAAQNANTQVILDKLCALELDGVKGQLAAAQRENVGLQNALNMASFRESQANQNALFAQGMNAEVDALYNRLKNCPVNTVPVYGNQPIFTCPNNGYNGCGCGAA